MRSSPFTHAGSARDPHRRTISAFVAAVLLSLNATAHAAIFRCVDVNGTAIYSDRMCDSPKEAEPSPSGANATGSAANTFEHRPDSAREKKAAHILDLLHIAPVEPETLNLQRTVDDAAPDLVKALDPDNALWTPANGRWHAVSEFVKADLRKDAQSALRVSAAQVAQLTAREYVARAQDSDMNALLRFLETPDGTSYVAFQNEIRPVLYSALASLLAQDPMPEDVPTDLALRQRRELLSMALEYRVIKDGGGTSTAELRPGSVTVAENAVRREGVVLDALFAEYEPFLPRFQSFTDSNAAKRFFAAVEPALRTERALSSTATTDFAEQEFDRYVQRWRAIYGPPMRVTTRTTISIRGRMVSIAHTTQSTVTAAGSPEFMAIQCEERDDGAYQQAHRNSRDGNAQATELKVIQNRCRAEQHLPPL
jgi:Domain of unknown function (DUF4124)